jgi:hypothetical protein
MPGKKPESAAGLILSNAAALLAAILLHCKQCRALF